MIKLKEFRKYDGKTISVRAPGYKFKLLFVVYFPPKYKWPHLDDGEFTISLKRIPNWQNWKVCEF